MIVTELFTIGKTTMPSSWLALIAAFVVAYSVVRIRYGKNISETLLDALFYFVIVWKLSVIVTDFGSVIKSPLSIIYFHGGLVGFYLGLLAASLRILLEARRGGLGRIDRVALFTGFVIIQTVYQVMMVLLNEGAIVAEVMTMMSFILFALFVWVTIRKANYSPVQLVLLFMAMHFFVGAFQPAGILGTSVLATLFIGLFFVFILFKEFDIEAESEGSV